jgi:hypothetical protein
LNFHTFYKFGVGAFFKTDVESVVQGFKIIYPPSPIPYMVEFKTKTSSPKELALQKLLKIMILSLV